MSKIKLNGETYNLVFDLNTYSAYEEKTGQFFLEALARIQEATEKAADLSPSQRNLALLKQISLKDIRALLWAAIHHYDGDEAIWPLSIVDVGRLVNFGNLVEIIGVILRGAASSNPLAEEVPPADRPTVANRSEDNAGGAESGELPDIISTSVQSGSDG